MLGTASGERQHSEMGSEISFHLRMYSKIKYLLSDALCLWQAVILPQFAQSFLYMWSINADFSSSKAHPR